MLFSHTYVLYMKEEHNFTDSNNWYHRICSDHYLYVRVIPISRTLAFYLLGLQLANYERDCKCYIFVCYAFSHSVYSKLVLSKNIWMCFEMHICVCFVRS
jgi:hypothetical protein